MLGPSDSLMHVNVMITNNYLWTGSDKTKRIITSDIYTG